MARSLTWEKDGANWPNHRFSHFVEAGGCRWHIQRAGKGPRILLLHGTGASTHSWAGLFPRLSARCSVLAPDLPGHAFTTPLGAANSSLPQMAASLDQLLRETGFQPDILIGHSAGAAIAVRLAAERKIRPTCIVAINGALRPLGGIAGLAGPAIAKAITISPLMVMAISRGGNDRDRVARLIRSTGSEPSEPYLSLYTRLFSTPSHVRGTLRMMASWDVSGILSDLKRSGCPLVQITGARDQAVAPAAAAELARQEQRASHIPLPRLGHLAHEEDPETLSQTILAAIDTCECEGRRQRA